MMKLLLLISSLLFTFYSLPAQDTIRIKVMDESGFPLAGARAQSSCSDQIFYSGAKGTVLLILNCERVDFVLVTHPFFQEGFHLNIQKTQTEYSVIMKRELALEEINVTSSVWQADKVLSSIRMTSESFEKLLTDKDIPYLLSSLPSVQVQSDAGNGIGYTGFRIRGIDPNQVQISLNGIPLNDSESSRTYFVNTPDLISDVDHVDIMTGYVPGRAGTGGFGAAVDLFTNRFQNKPSARFKSQVGSFNSVLNSLYFSTGLLNNKFSVEGRLSRQLSDGYIERSSSVLNGIFLGASIINKKSSLRINFVRGDERTGQAWFGLPFSYFKIDSLRRFNLAGLERPEKPYPNDVDQYTQTHTQAFYNHQISAGTSLVFNANFTDGYGYYENYKADSRLSDFGLQHPDSLYSDLVRRKWLDNDFYYLYSGMEHIWDQSHSSSFGLSASHYVGNHFGRVSWVDLDPVSYLSEDYYRNKGVKDEITLFAKHAWKISDRWMLASDFHVRNVRYRSSGTDDTYGDIEIKRQFLLWNPKLAAQYKISQSWLFSGSASWYEREPYRDDLLSSPLVDKEKLLDIELGFQWSGKFGRIGMNSYWMNYFDFLALNGDLNDTGDPLRTQIASAYRYGLEFNVTVKPFSFLSIEMNTALSQNKAAEFNEVLPSFGTIPPRINEKVSGRDLAFSPTQLHNFSINLDWGGWTGLRWLPESIYTQKWIGRQFMDLSGSEEAALDAYSIGSFRLQWRSNHKNFMLSGFFQIHNIWNELYSSHGWILRFVSDLPLEPGDPYLGVGSEETRFYKGLYPQAPRHFTAGITIGF